MMKDKTKGKKNLKKICAAFLCITAVILVILALVAAFDFLGLIVMKAFGFEYESIGSLIAFFVITEIISVPVDIFIEALPKVLNFLGKLKDRHVLIFRIMLGTICTSLIMGLTDAWLDSVHAPTLSVVMVSLFFTLLNIVLEEKTKD